MHLLMVTSGVAKSLDFIYGRVRDEDDIDNRGNRRHRFRNSENVSRTRAQTLLASPHSFASCSTNRQALIAEMDAIISAN